MNCKKCNDPLFTVAEMDEYQMCHACYCEVFDKSKNTQTQTQGEIQ